jgi:hypothetical protein
MAIVSQNCEIAASRDGAAVVLASTHSMTSGSSEAGHGARIE